MKSPVGAAPIDPALRSAADRGAAALTSRLGQLDPASLAVPDYLARRYGLDALAGAGDRARDLIRTGNFNGGSTVLNALVQPRSRPPDPAELRLTPPYEQAIAAALVCEPRDETRIAARVRAVSRPGGYSLTHGALAFEVARERGCLRAAPASRLRSELASSMRSESHQAPNAVDDLAIERLAILALLGEAMPEEPVRAVATAQRRDGTWADPTGRVPEWHSTMLGVWVMAAAADRGERVPFVGGGRQFGSTTAQFTPREARRFPAPNRSARHALQVLAHDPSPSATDVEAIHHAMEEVGPVAEVTPLDPAVRDELASDLRSARTAAGSVATIPRARRRGFRLASRALPGIGAHWIRWDRVIAPFDPRRPAMLLFDGDSPSARLVGFSFLLRSRTEPQGFRPGGARWHRHAGLCVVRGVLVAEQVQQQRECPGVLIRGRDLWMLHAWVVPGRPNPWGTFAPLNPGLCSPDRPCVPAGDERAPGAVASIPGAAPADG